MVLRDDATSSVQATWRVLLALQEALQEELEHMKYAGIVTNVTKPTDWVSPFEYVLNPGGLTQAKKWARRKSGPTPVARYEGDGPIAATGMGPGLLLVNGQPVCRPPAHCRQSALGQRHGCQQPYCGCAWPTHGPVTFAQWLLRGLFTANVRFSVLYLGYLIYSHALNPFLQLA